MTDEGPGSDNHTGPARAGIPSTGAVRADGDDGEVGGAGGRPESPAAALRAATLTTADADAGAGHPADRKPANRVGVRMNRVSKTKGKKAGKTPVAAPVTGRVPADDSASPKRTPSIGSPKSAFRRPGIGRKEPFDAKLLRAIIPGYSRNGSGKAFTFYGITVKYKTSSWIVNRRYSQFEELHRKLSAVHKHRVPKLPPKTLNPNPSDPAFLARRRQALEAYLHAVLTDSVLRGHQYLASFLALDPGAANSGYIDHDWMSRTGGGSLSESKSRNPCAIL